MLTLFIANKMYSSWSLRPWVLMRELNIPFTEKLVPFSENNIEEFRKFSPTSKVPCLFDDENKLVVWESLAIAEYLAEKFPKVWAQDPVARAWSRSAASEMHAGFSGIRQHCSMHCGVRIALHTITPALQADINRLTELWEEGLNRFGGPFLAGKQFTAVDAFFAPIAFRVQSYGLKLSPAAAQYVQHLLDLPAMREWEREALLESWREPEHEKEVMASGVLIKDLRS